MALQNDGGPAPYAQTKSVNTVIDAYRDKGLQVPFTVGVLTRAGVSDGLAPRTIQTLKILDLIDEEGKPTDSLEALRLATFEDYPNRLADIIRAAYAPIFSFADPAQDNQEQVRDAFRVYTPQGQQPRMVALFYGLCEKAGIISELPARLQSASTAKPRVKRSPTSARAKTHMAHDEKNMPPVHSEGIPATIMALLQEHLPKEKTWTKNERDAFVQMFGAFLDFSYTVQEKPAPPDWVNNAFGSNAKEEQAEEDNK